MPQRSGRDRLLLYAIVTTIAVLAIGFPLARMYMQHVERQNRDIRFLQLPSIAISRDGHSIAASFAIRTSAGDAEWAKKNKPALEQVMQHALMALDPANASTPGGLKAFQDTLRDASNSTLETSQVQEVLITDFLVSEGDQ